ncbi:acetolactate synthase small subunit [Candidatus Gracilibacteria bacterium]|nr:acetolactate synthase small subunit [Candidatus Gracilibacteria bacterium]
MEKQILSVLVENKPGVLFKISGLLRRKRFQIDSLTVGKTADETVAQFTIVILGTLEEAQKTVGMLNRIVDVFSVEILDKDSIVREIVLARLELDSENQRIFLQEAEQKILVQALYQKNKEICVELIDTSQKIEEFLFSIKKANIKILEWIRSGVIAIKK